MAVDGGGVFAVVRVAALAVIVRRLARPGPRRLRAADASGGEPISVVIPARDEAARLEPAVRSALAANDVAEVIVVDDQSMDATAEVAARAGACVVAPPERPAGWAGKTWAVQHGVGCAMNDWVVTLDADARVDPALPPAIVARARQDDALVSVSPTFEPFRSRAAQWLHASMLATLAYRFGRPGSAPVSRTIVSGQCMAFSRARFVAWGGFEPVAASPIEDVALARWLTSAGHRVEFVEGDGLLTVEPYSDATAVWSQWGRSLGLAGVESTGRRALDVVLLAITMPLPVVRALLRRADAIDLLAGAVRLGTLIGTRRAYVRPGPGAWMAPAADVVAVAALALSLPRRRRVWRGRSYVH